MKGRGSLVISAGMICSVGLCWRGIAKRLKGDAAAGETDIAAAKTIDPEVEQ
jgi:hypothetical protein